MKDVKKKSTKRKSTLNTDFKKVINSVIRKNSITINLQKEIPVTTSIPANTTACTVYTDSANALTAVKSTKIHVTTYDQLITAMATDGADIVLDADLTVGQYYIKQSGANKLDLNGHTITGTYSNPWCNVYGNFTLDDTKGGGKITEFGGSGGCIYLGNYSNFTMMGGIISNCTITRTPGPSQGGGAVSIMSGNGDGATFNMYGGVIDNCTSPNYSGGAIIVGESSFRSGTAIFNMYGGVIRNCSSGVSGGAVHIVHSGCVFNMFGGCLQHNTAPTNPVVSNNGGTFTQTGGYIFDSLTDSIYERNANKVTSITAESTDVQYPSAKAVYDLVHKMLESYGGKK